MNFSDLALQGSVKEQVIILSLIGIGIIILIMILTVIKKMKDK